MVAHCYQYSRTHSTFLVEAPPDTFRTAGLDRLSEADSLAYCEAAFAEDLDGHRLLSNRSAWFRYTIVRNVNWHFDNVVLLGDALRTGHPSIGSGTRLALQDSIALFEAYRTAGGDVPLMLEEFAGSVARVPTCSRRPPSGARSGTSTSETSCTSTRSRSRTTTCGGAAG
jgi:2-polyprenyl-6-methoxyphenol hydroxylase-like FAD-dependent oxidoreductase